MAAVPNLDKLPIDLKAQRRWTPWRYEIRDDGKTTKRPLRRIDKPNTWISLSEACDFITSGKADGVGFVLGDGIIGIDIDNCIDRDGTLHEIAKDLIALGTYTEISVSGRGLHAYLRAKIARPCNIRSRDGLPGREIYDRARYFTATGERVGEASDIRTGPEVQVALDAFYAKWFTKASEPVSSAVNVVRDAEQELDDDEVLRLLFNEVNGAKWRLLFEGEWCEYYPSQSEADLALCRKLYYYTRSNAVQMNRILRRSGLMRSKWDQMRGTLTYADITIAAAMRLGGRVYTLPCPKYKAEAQEGQYGKVHRSTLPIRAKMSKTDNLVYDALTTYADGVTGECDPSATTIARVIGNTREHVQTSIGSLAAIGLISVTPRPGRTSIIRLLAYGGVANFDTTAKGKAPKGRAHPNGIARSLDPRRRQLLRRL